MDEQHLEQGLAELGLRHGDIVEVHSSLRAFGRIQGGARTLITALQKAVGPDGTIAMSAYRVSAPIPLSDADVARGIQWKVRILPEGSREKTGLGAVVEEFTRMPGVICGMGVHRVCALGKEARIISQGYRHLVDRGGYVLLMGVDIYRCSSMHVAEEVSVPEDIKAFWRIPDGIKNDYDPSAWSVGYGGTPESGWTKVFSKADEQGLVRRRQIGSAECMLFKAKDVVRIFEDWRRTDPYGLYGIKRSPP